MCGKLLWGTSICWHYGQPYFKTLESGPIYKMLRITSKPKRQFENLGGWLFFNTDLGVGDVINAFFGLERDFLCINQTLEFTRTICGGKT